MNIPFMSWWNWRANNYSFVSIRRNKSLVSWQTMRQIFLIIWICPHFFLKSFIGTSEFISFWHRAIFEIQVNRIIFCSQHLLDNSFKFIDHCFKFELREKIWQLLYSFCELILWYKNFFLCFFSHFKNIVITLTNISFLNSEFHFIIFHVYIFHAHKVSWIEKIFCVMTKE